MVEPKRISRNRNCHQMKDTFVRPAWYFKLWHGKSWAACSKPQHQLYKYNKSSRPACHWLQLDRLRPRNGLTLLQHTLTLPSTSGVCERQLLRQTTWNTSSPNNRPRYHPTSAEWHHPYAPVPSSGISGNPQRAFSLAGGSPDPTAHIMSQHSLLKWFTTITVCLQKRKAAAVASECE